LPEIAVLPLLLAFPVFPELALPDLAPVMLKAPELALPLVPPVAEPVAVLAPELPDSAKPVTGDPVLLYCAGFWNPTPMAPADAAPVKNRSPPARPPIDAAFHLDVFDMISFRKIVRLKLRYGSCDPSSTAQRADRPGDDQGKGNR
jgi:hypothetical protein